MKKQIARDRDPRTLEQKSSANSRHEVDVQREELAKLQEQMHQFILQLEEQQRAQAVAAEKRELKLAEEEREQATVWHELRARGVQ